MGNEYVFRVVIFGLFLAVGLLALLSRRWPLLIWGRGKSFLFPKVARAQPVRLIDVPQIVEAMARASAKVRYAGLTFNTLDLPGDDDAVNLNLSFENERVGFDWVLLAPRNLRDKTLFKEFSRAHGIEAIPRSMNGVSYLRVECKDIAGFTASVVTEMYACPHDQPLALFHDGFTWELGSAQVPGAAQNEL